MCHHNLCHAKVVHLLVMSCYDTDLHVMSPPSISCPFVSRDVSADHECHVMSARIRVHTCHVRVGQVKACQLKSFHVFAQKCQIRDRFRRLSHIDFFSHCLALLLPDSLSVSPSESLKLSLLLRSHTASSSRNIALSHSQDLKDPDKFHAVFACPATNTMNIMTCGFVSKRSMPA